MTGPAQNKLTPLQHQRVRAQLGEVMAHINAGRTDRAAAALTPLLRKHPDLPEAAHVASGLHARRGEGEQALYHARRAAQLAPHQPEYQAALGVLLVQNERHQQAIGALERALSADPDLRQAIVALGVAHMQLGAIARARELFNRALAAHPDDREAVNNLALLESDLGHAHRAVEIIEAALQTLGDDPLLLDALCMFSSYDDELTPEQVFAIHERFGACVEGRVRSPAAHPNDPDPERRIKLAFLSPDLRAHSVAYFLEPIFEHLDHERFELCVYSTTRHPDETTRRLRACADTWRDCTQGIARAHKQILDDRADILVELAGHFAGNQLPLHAARPAPLGVTMIGYGNTTGLTVIDARLADDITDPAPRADALATEKLVRIPPCFLCYRPPTLSPEQGATDPTDPDPQRPFTFASFNDLRKMSPSCLRLWARILAQNPGTRLLLKTSRLAHEEVRDELTRRLGDMADMGVDPDRLELRGRTDSMHDHLDLYNRADCALDTFPYTGTTTTCEAAYMGVPTITLLGEAHAGRVSASLLTAIGRKDLIARDPDHYLALASRAAASGRRSRADRLALRNALAQSPLCDAGAYTRRVEAALRDLWRGWCDARAREGSAS